MLNTITRRVRRGAALLDRERPDWFEEVDTRTLDVGLYENCPLGQLYGNFLTGYFRLGMTLGSATRHGFLASLWATITGRYSSQSDRLTEAWLVEVRTRRQANATGLKLVHERCRARNVPIGIDYSTGKF